MEEQEIWKDVPGYEKSYEVSNLGRVKIKPRLIKMPRGGYRKSKSGIVERKPLISRGKRPYTTCSLSKNSKTKSYLLHQVIAMAFLNHNPETATKIVDHIDNDSLNNRLDNLQIISLRKNSTKDRKPGVSGKLGVYFESKSQSYFASTGIKGVKIRLARSKSKKDIDYLSRLYITANDNIDKFNGCKETFVKFVKDKTDNG